MSNLRIEVEAEATRLLTTDATLGWDGAMATAGTNPRIAEAAMRAGMVALAGHGGIGQVWVSPDELVALGWTPPATPGATWTTPRIGAPV